MTLCRLYQLTSKTSGLRLRIDSEHAQITVVPTPSYIDRADNPTLIVAQQQEHRVLSTHDFFDVGAVCS